MKKIFLVVLVIFALALPAISAPAKEPATWTVDFRFIKNFRELVQDDGQSMCQKSWVIDSEDPDLAHVVYSDGKCSGGKLVKYVWTSGARRVFPGKGGSWVQVPGSTKEKVPTNTKATSSLSKLGPKKYRDDIRHNAHEVQYYGTFKKFRAQEYLKYMGENQDSHFIISNSPSVCIQSLEDIDDSSSEIRLNIYPDDKYISVGYVGCKSYGIYSFSLKERFIIYDVEKNESGKGYIFVSEPVSDEDTLPKPTEFDLGRGEIGRYVQDNAKYFIGLTNNKDGFFAIFLGYKTPKVVRFDPWEGTPYDPINTMGGDVILIKRKLKSENGAYEFIPEQVVTFPKAKDPNDAYGVFNYTFTAGDGDYIYYIMCFPAKYMGKGKKYGFYSIGHGGSLNTKPSTPYITTPK